MSILNHKGDTYISQVFIQSKMSYVRKLNKSLDEDELVTEHCVQGVQCVSESDLGTKQTTQPMPTCKTLNRCIVELSFRSMD